ncbi:hypothetical protein [Cryobacterium tagatosivorans]|uniref:Uncharacterized protein n=1 Tax=Cryobacterium tagatosivorans TaxID=1259199 RepID=A0A4V3I716_9MICO|nr:hypothetical protein [Cryobacterium tagatosivorans]TFB56750.1 hypothetical protein E3O23_00600 [Cryobacterium tagatosivorans]
MTEFMEAAVESSPRMTDPRSLDGAARQTRAQLPERFPTTGQARTAEDTADADAADIAESGRLRSELKLVGDLTK